MSDSEKRKDKEIAKYALKKLADFGMQKAAVRFIRNKKQEMNADTGRLSLMRTSVDIFLNLTAISGGRKASMSLNAPDKNEIEKSAEKLLTLLKESKPDSAHDIAAFQPAEVFDNLVVSPDLDLMYERLSGFLAETKKHYPEITLGTTILDFNRSTKYFLNSNGADFEVNKGIYDFYSMFSAKKGKKVSSFNYGGFSYKKIDRRFMECVLFGNLMKQLVQQLDTKKNPAKFTGDIILMPHTLEDFINMYLSATVTDYPLISKSSIFFGKLGKKVADSKLTIYSAPMSDEIDNGYFLTPDGYKTDNMPIIENGVLKNYILSLYGANKTGFKRSVSAGGAYMVSAGDANLEDMIKSVEKGIILGRFSGGDISANCDFSGVAKNSYLVENGKVKFPLSETMVSGNMVDLFNNIKAISKERINDGSNITGWICCGGGRVS